MKSFRRVVCDVSDDSNKSADDKVATFVDNLRLLHALSSRDDNASANFINFCSYDQFL